MYELQWGFYETETISPDDFQGIDDSGELFQKMWVEKDYDEIVRVVALDCND